jgi:hypothetical protein
MSTQPDKIARATIGDFFKAAPRARKEPATNFCNAAKKALCLRLTQPRCDVGDTERRREPST